jgi:hypothetical protein
MNLQWTFLTTAQRDALTALCHGGPCPLPGDVGEQLYNLGLADFTVRGLFRITAAGLTVLPQTIH